MVDLIRLLRARNLMNVNNSSKLLQDYYPNAITESRSQMAVAVRSLKNYEVLGTSQGVSVVVRTC